MTASKDKTAKICGRNDGHWQEKAIIKHDDWVKSGCFSPDSKRIVTASRDPIAKIYEVSDSDGQWQEKTTIKHDGPVNSACFNPDGKHVMTASGTPGSNSKFVANVYMLIGKESKYEYV